MFFQRLHNFSIDPKLNQLFREIDTVYNSHAMLLFGYGETTYAELSSLTDLEPLGELDLPLELKRAWGGAHLKRIIEEMQHEVDCRQNPGNETNVTGCDGRPSYFALSCVSTFRKACLLFRKKTSGNVVFQHETTLAGLMSTFGFKHLDFDRDRLPDLASALFLELWHNADDDQNPFYVKVCRFPNDF